MTPSTDSGVEQVDREEASSSTKLAERRLGKVVAGSYRLTRHIGSGGSGDVYEAEQVRLGKRFALKVLRSELATSQLAAKRFRREVRAIARIQSEHIVSVVDCGELDEGTPFFVMELLVGEDLRSLLQKERVLVPRRAAALIADACRGVAALHAAGLVHRDLKPENLFVAQRDGGQDWCKVLDFGVAKMESSVATSQGAIIGTVRYMAPEQLSDPGSVAPAADIYALGAILYECLSGQAAQRGQGVQEVMYSILNSQPAPLSKLRPELPSQLASLVDRCLAKNPSDRPGTALQLGAELTAIFALPFVSTGSSSTLADASLLLTPSVTKRPRERSFWKVVLIGASTAVAGWVAGRSLPSDHPPAPSLAATARPRPQTVAATAARPADIVVSAAPSPTAPRSSSADAPTQPSGAYGEFTQSGQLRDESGHAGRARRDARIISQEHQSGVRKDIELLGNDSSVAGVSATQSCRIPPSRNEHVGEIIGTELQRRSVRNDQLLDTVRIGAKLRAECQNSVCLNQINDEARTHAHIRLDRVIVVR